ncbi:MAG: protein-L-isoaspartate(D-aspartate) O-methyltransferase [bacterium]
MANYKNLIEKMINSYIISKGIYDAAIINAIRSIPRHNFVEESFSELSYTDVPLPIGHKQTISGIYTAALMTSALELNKNHKVLEIGTGSGYQTAILANLASEVYTIERIRELSLKSRTILENLNLKNITFIIGDGSIGFKEYAPYDRIIVTACLSEIPKALVDQLKDGGIIVMPVEVDSKQNIFVIRKNNDKIDKKIIAPANFVKLVGKSGFAA